MELGTFSVSLAVKDLAKSLSFYETLGFNQIDGDVEIRAGQRSPGR